MGKSRYLTPITKEVIIVLVFKKGGALFRKRRRTTEELLDELAHRYYGKPYNELCSRRKKIIDEYAKEEPKSARN